MRPLTETSRPASNHAPGYVALPNPVYFFLRVTAFRGMLYAFSLRSPAILRKRTRSVRRIATYLSGGVAMPRQTWLDASFLGLVIVSVVAVYVFGSWLTTSCRQSEVDNIQQHARDLDALNRAHFDTLDGIDNTARNNAAVRGDDGLAKLFSP